MKQTRTLISILLFALCISIPISNGQLGCLPTGITFSTQGAVDNFKLNYPGCTIIGGDVEFIGAAIMNLDSLENVTEIQGDLGIFQTSLSSLQGLHNLVYVGGSLGISANNSLTSLTHLSSLILIAEGIALNGDGILSLNGLQGITEVNGNLWIEDSPNLMNLTGLNNISNITGGLFISHLDALNDISALGQLHSVVGELTISVCNALPSLLGLGNLTNVGSLSIMDNAILSSIQALDHNILIGDVLMVSRNPQLSNCAVESFCNFLSLIPGHAYISNNSTNCSSPAKVDSICLANAIFEGASERGKGVAINTQASVPDSSAILDLQSETQTLILPRMSSIQRRGIKNPAPGAIVFDTYLGEPFFHNGNMWQDINRGDNLGDHEASETLNMGGHNIRLEDGYIGYHGVNEGITISPTGSVLIKQSGYSDAISPGAALQIKSGDGGLLVPYVDSTIMYSYPTEESDGLMVYDSARHELMIYNDSLSEWRSVNDNLGNHTADQNLNLSGNEITLSDGWISNDGDEEGIKITDDGNVGLGTDAPARKLHVANGFIKTDLTYGLQLESQAGFYSEISTSGNELQITNYGTGGIELSTGTTLGTAQKRMKIKDTGEVGIGTVNPDYLLHVEGSESSGGIGYFKNTISSSDQYGVYGECANTTNWGFGGYFNGGYRGVYGEAAPSDNIGIGGYFKGGSRGVVGIVEIMSSPNEYRGVSGIVHGGDGNGFGVFGEAYGTGINYGVYGTAYSGTSNYAGYFDYGIVQINDSLSVLGNISKGGGSFKIDHPLDPANKYLSHSFVESPDMMNIYNGNVTTDGQGKALVEMPDWFEALNRDFRYQLTVIGQFAQAIISKEITNRKFEIMTDKPYVKVSWQVTGIRHDAYAEKHRIPVETMKKNENRGKYLHPDAFGLQKEAGINQVKHSKEKEKNR